MNFFEPELIIDNKLLKVHKYEEVLKEQLMIGILSKGAIGLSDTNNLPVNDRRILLTTLQKAEEAKAKRMEEIQQTRASMRGSKRF